jgi:hypothetical protein
MDPMAGRLEFQPQAKVVWRDNERRRQDRPQPTSQSSRQRWS